MTFRKVSGRIVKSWRARARSSAVVNWGKCSSVWERGLFYMNAGKCSYPAITRLFKNFFFFLKYLPDVFCSFNLIRLTDERVWISPHNGSLGADRVCLVMITVIGFNKRCDWCICTLYCRDSNSLIHPSIHSSIHSVILSNHLILWWIWSLS